MNAHELVARAREEVKAYARSIAQRAIFFTRVSATTTDGQADGVEGWPADGGDPDSGQQTARRMEPWGVHGRPAVGVQALVARALGGAAQGLLVGIWTGGHGRQNLDKGETQLYCVATGAEVYLDKNGAVFINATAGQLIKIAGGTDFEVKGTTYRTAERTMNLAIQAAISTATGSVAAAGSVADLKAAFATLFSAWTGAITTFEAGNANYLSTIAKVG